MHLRLHNSTMEQMNFKEKQVTLALNIGKTDKVTSF